MQLRFRYIFKKLTLLLCLTDFSRTSFCSSVDTNRSQKNSFPFAPTEQNKTGSPVEKWQSLAAGEHPGTACRSTAGLCPHRTHGAFRNRQSQVPGTAANPKCFTAILAAALRLRKGSFTSALTSAEPLEVPIHLSHFQNTTAPVPAHPRPADGAGPWGRPGAGSAAGPGPLAGLLPAPPCCPPSRPPTWSCGQFNQPSFPKLSQPARAIVTAGKNRQASFMRCFMGSSYSLVQGNFKAGCYPLIPAKLPWTNNGLKAIQLSLSSTMHFISHSVLSSV